MTLSDRLKRLIPKSQAEVMKSSKEFIGIIYKLDNINIPKIGETDGKKRHPLALHYFVGGCDWYICEWDGEDEFFGYAILNDDLHNSEWGYMNREELVSCHPLVNLDLYCPHETIEDALFERSKEYFIKYKKLNAIKG